MVKLGKVLFFLLVWVIAEKTIIAQKPNLEASFPKMFAYGNPHNHFSANCGINFLIPDNSCTAASNYPFVVTAPGTQLGIDIVLEEVRLIISHPWDADLDIFLSSPAGKKVELSSDNGGGADHYGDPSDTSCAAFTSFSMSACHSITEGLPPFIGSYLPEGNFNDFHDGSNPNGSWTFQICDDALDDFGSLHFVELVFSSSICQAPSSLNIEAIGSQDVSLSWDANNMSCSNTFIEYGPPGFTPGTDAAAGGGTVLPIACNTPQPYLLTGLTELTDYELYIREACSGGGFSGNSCVLDFTTACNTAALSLLEDFDSQAECEKGCDKSCTISGTWSNSLDDEMDWLIDKEGTSSSNTGPSDDITEGGNYIYLETSGAACQQGYRAVLHSTCIDVVAASGQCHFSFYYHMLGNSTGSLSFDITLDGGSNWQNLWTANGEQGDSWFRQFIDLGSYHGQIAQFRFVATKGNGFRGDIAIDQLEFFGSQEVGGSIQFFFADVDGDGFGDAAAPLISCTAQPPPGYVADSTDCDDAIFAVNPGAAEQACNGIDENCNGMSDEYLVAAPAVENVSICRAGQAVLYSSLPIAGNLYWYRTDPHQLLWIGDTLHLANVQNAYHLVVLDSLSASCFSDTAEVSVNILPVPEISVQESPAICAGASYDLANLNIEDTHLTGGSISFHSASPASPANKLPSSVVMPSASAFYYILSTTNSGCTDEASIELVVHQTPSAAISPFGTAAVCSNGSIILEAYDAGAGSPPYHYQWSTGSINNRILALAQQPGTSATYSFSLTDANGCQSTASTEVFTSSSITSVSIDNIENVSSCNGNDGQIQLSPLDGVSPYSYHWSGPSNGSADNLSGTYLIDNLLQGAYRISITDSNPLNCELVIPIININGPSIEIDQNIVITDVSCYGLANGSVDISTSSNASMFMWSNGATTEDLIGVAAGSYAVTVSDGVCSQIVDGIQVSQPDSLVISLFETQSPICQGNADGSINLSVQGGTAPYQFEWSDNSTQEDLLDVPAGQYSVTVTDAQNCQKVLADIALDEPEALEFALLEVTNPSCFDQQDGSINVQISGGTPPYTYHWSNGTNQKDLVNIGSGTYQLIVEDAKACQLQSGPIQVSEPAELQIQLLSLEDASCEGIDNGSLSVEVTGGNGAYSYQWSNGASTASFGNLAPGIYQLTVEDAMGCRKVSPGYTILAPEVLTLDGVFTQHATCLGIDDGFLDVSLSGGTMPYQYLWDNGMMTEDIFGLSAGLYTLTITDANGCRMITPAFEIDVLTALQGRIDGIFDISCFGANDGRIFTSPPSGAPPFQYVWNNGATSDDLSGLSAGSYQATITDQSGCQYITDTILISEPPMLIVHIIAVEDVTCRAAIDGSIDASVSGGTPPYIFNWNDGSQMEDLSNASAGLYVLTVIDANGCVANSVEVQVNELSDLNVSIDNITHVGCTGSDDGSIDVTISGGVQPYQILWSNGDTTEDLQKLNAGLYDVSIVDANGCAFEGLDFEVLQIRDSIAVQFVGMADESCAGEVDGLIIPGNLGGQGPYQFNWSNGNLDSINHGLPPGTYDLTITDAGGCVGVSEPLTISPAVPINYLVDQIAQESCFGSADGAIDITISGGAPPYNYLWSNSFTGEDPAGLAAGSYTLSITDANGCTFTIPQPITIPGPDAPLSMSSFQTNAELCFGAANGSLFIHIIGGSLPYQYLWNTGATTPFLPSISSGHYQCTITDANGCQFETGPLMVDGPEENLAVDAFASTVETASYCRGNDGSISLQVVGGTPPYQYLWNNGDTTAFIDALIPGLYICFITDANQCFLESAMIEVTATDAMLSQTSSTPASGQNADGTATVEVSGGAWPYSFQWDDQTGSQTDSVATSLQVGTYYVTLTDADDCTLVDSAVVEQLVSNEEVFAASEIQVFPNPSKDEVFIKTPVMTQAVQWHLYDLQGRQIPIAVDQEQPSLWHIRLPELPQGVYIWQLISGQHSASGRLLIQY